MRDHYDREAARFLLGVLSSCSGPVRVMRGPAVSASCHGTSGDVLGEHPETHSDYPDWYRDATCKRGSRDGRGLGFDGDNIRAALEAIADGRAPNLAQQEARWIAQRIADARAQGDATLNLPACEGRADGMGGARRMMRQARLTCDGAVARVPLRIPEASLAPLREMAAARGVTLNALLVGILSDYVASRDGDVDHGDGVPF